MEDYDKALDYTQNALSGFLNRNDDINIINALNNIGSIYYFQKNIKFQKTFMSNHFRELKRSITNNYWEMQI